MIEDAHVFLLESAPMMESVMAASTMNDLRINSRDGRFYTQAFVDLPS
jgi:hypothetical protein